MAPNLTTDTATIARRVASVCYGSSSTGAGSWYNPQGLTDNCVFVSLASMLNMTAPELSDRTRLEQPINGSGGIETDIIMELMDRAKAIGLVDDFVMSDVPFQYGMFWKPRGNRLDSSLVFYYTGPPRPDGRRPGHCVVSLFGGLVDFQHLGGPQYKVGEYFPFFEEIRDIAATIQVRHRVGQGHMHVTIRG